MRKFIIPILSLLAAAATLRRFMTNLSMTKRLRITLPTTTPAGFRSNNLMCCLRPMQIRAHRSFCSQRLITVDFILCALSRRSSRTNEADWLCWRRQLNAEKRCRSQKTCKGDLISVKTPSAYPMEHLLIKTLRTCRSRGSRPQRAVENCLRS